MQLIVELTLAGTQRIEVFSLRFPSCSHEVMSHCHILITVLSLLNVRLQQRWRVVPGLLAPDA